MYGKKTAAALFILLLLYALAGCASNGHNQTPGAASVQVNKTGWFIKRLGFKDTAIAQIQVTDDGIVLVLAEGRIYQDEGGGFKEISTPELISVFFVMEKDNTRKIIAGSGSGALYIKDFRDQDWQNTSLPAYHQPVSTIAGDVNNGSIYVGQAGKLGGGIWKSPDNGNTWEKLSADTARGVVVHPENSNILYATDRVTRLSADQGKTWAKIDSAANYGVLIHPLSPELSYLVFSQGVVTAQHDGKITDSRRFELPGAITCLELNFAKLGEWAAGMWDYPSGAGGLYFSFDSGENWSLIEELGNTRITDMRFDKKGNLLYIGTAGKGLWVLNLEEVRKQAE